MNQVFVFVCICGIVATALGCTIDLPWYARSPDKTKNEVDDLKINFSQVVVFGQAVKNVTGDYPLSTYEGVYTIEFRVLCSYKGGVLPETIYIAGIGNKKDTVPECPRVSVNLGADFYYVMFLKRTSKPNVFEIEYKPNEASSETVDLVLDDLTINCGLTLVDGGDAICSEMIPLTEEDGCQKYKPPKPTTTTARVTEATEATEATPMPTEENKKDVEVDVEPKAEDDSDNQSDQGYDTETLKPGGKTGNTVDDGNRGGSNYVTASMLFTTIIASIIVLL